MSTNQSQGMGLADLNSLMAGGVEEGLITQTASQKVAAAAAAAGGLQILQGADGQHPDDLESTSVTLGLIVADDSGSMYSYQRDLIDSYNECIAKMGRSTERPNIKLSLWTVREKPTNISKGFLSVPDLNLDPSKDLKKAAALAQNQGCIQPADMNVFRTDAGGTALHDTAFEALGGALALATKYEKAGCLNRLVVVFISDGEDNNSHKHSAKDVNDLISAAMRREKIIPAFFGMGTPAIFEGISDSYGIPRRNLKVAKQVDKKVLGDIFNFVSATIISASQGIVPVPASQIQGTSPFLV